MTPVSFVKSTESSVKAVRNHTRDADESYLPKQTETDLITASDQIPCIAAIVGFIAILRDNIGLLHEEKPKF